MKEIVLKRLIVGMCGAVLLLFAGSGCHSASSDSPDVKTELTLDPSPPVVGNNHLTLKLTDANGAPLEGAMVKVEGNMNHAGMTPSFADLKETKPGDYEGTLKFTMGGDWFLLVSAETPDGEVVERKIDVPGVKAK